MSDEEQQKCDCEEGLPAWMGTFADLMSLLMCFFVLLLSFSEMDAMKFKRLAGSMAQAFGVQNKLNVTDVPKGTSIIAQEFSPSIPEPTPINEIWQKTEDLTQSSLDFDCAQEFDVEQGDEAKDAGAKVRIKQKLEELIAQTEQDAIELAQALHDQIAAGEIEVETRGRQIIIRIREKGSFKSASAELNDDYYDVLSEIKEVLRVKPGKIEVQGHTDNVPIRTSRFRSNWELSSSRAVSVAHELMGDDINPRRFEVSGFSDTVPLVDNNSTENRARNRRVEIVIQQGLDEELNEEDINLLQEEGQDILRDLDLDPEYLFDLNPEEVF
ncbi:flagellar motor protein MotB [Maricurvus nonylphenolicus]|uniref:flagellar motor protein MotB n=1 Tax=Maricurvus nonylphenolicus TaxID=1008307 RepID=UPI0036F4237E